MSRITNTPDIPELSLIGVAHPYNWYILDIKFIHINPVMAMSPAFDLCLPNN